MFYCRILDCNNNKLLMTFFSRWEFHLIWNPFSNILGHDVRNMKSRSRDVLPLTRKHFHPEYPPLRFGNLNLFTKYNLQKKWGFLKSFLGFSRNYQHARKPYFGRRWRLCLNVDYILIIAGSEFIGKRKYFSWYIKPT